MTNRKVGGGFLLSICTALILAVLAPHPTGALQAAATSGAAAATQHSPPAAPPLVAIPTAEIASTAEATLGRLREAEKMASSVPDVEAIARDLPAMKAGVQEATIMLVQLEGSPGALRQLEDARARWTGADRRLTSWSERLTSRSVAMDATLQMLVLTEARWRFTRESLASEDVPAALLARVDEVITLTELRRKGIRERQRELLTLQAEVGDLAAQSDAGLEQAKRLLDRYRQQVFTADAPPLWKVIGKPLTGPGLREQIQNALLHDREALASFLGSAGQRPLLHLLFFFASLMILFTLRHKSQSWDLPAADEKAAAHILGRPVATSLVLTLMTTALFYIKAPSIVFEVNRILFLFPVLRLVPGLLGRASRRPLFVLAGLYLADNLVDLALEATFLQRMLLLASTLVSMAAGWWIARHQMDVDTSTTTGWLQHRLIHLALLILAASAVANIMGHISLAHLLTNATLTSAYGMFILFAATEVLGVLTSVLLHSRLAGLFRSLSRDAGLVRRKVGKLLNILAVGTWIAGTLYFFGLLGMVWNGVNRSLARQWSLGSLQLSLGNILAFMVAIWISVLISRLIRYVLMEDVLPHLTLARGMPSSIALLVHYAIISLGFLAALSAAGIELSRFAIMAGALGVGIGFGLQSLVNNFVSGLILIFERPMQIGDKIEVGQHRGEVRRIGFRASTIRTFAGAEIIVPNGDLISKELTNWTLSDHMRRVDVPVGVSYGSDPKEVMKILAEVADREPDCLKRPEPRVHFMEFGESSLNFIVRFWTPKFDEWWGVHSRMILGIHQALKEAGVTVPFPQRDLHLRTVDGKAAALLAHADIPGEGPSRPGD